MYIHEKLTTTELYLKILDFPRLEPIVISIWCGESKPNNISDYLRSFVDELQEIMENGILIDTCHIKIIIGAFICDSPARSFIKGDIIVVK